MVNYQTLNSIISKYKSWPVILQNYKILYFIANHSAEKCANSLFFFLKPSINMLTFFYFCS